MFQGAICYTDTNSFPIPQNNIEGVIKRLEGQYNQSECDGKKIIVRYRSSPTSLDHGANMERGKFTSLLRHISNYSVAQLPVSVSATIETHYHPVSYIDPEYEYLGGSIRRKDVMLTKDGDVVAYTDETFERKITILLEVSFKNAKEVIKRFEYIPTLIFLREFESEGNNREPHLSESSLVVRGRFQVNDVWTLESELRFSLPRGGFKAIRPHILSVLKGVPEFESEGADVDRERYMDILSMLAKRGPKQYQINLELQPTNVINLQRQLEAALLPILRSGSRGSEKEDSFKHINSIGIIWGVLQKYIKEFDSGTHKFIHEMFSRGTIVFASLLSPVRSGSLLTLSEVYQEIDTNQYYLTKKIDGLRTLVTIIFLRNDGARSYRVSLIESNSVNTSVRHWIFGEKLMEMLFSIGVVRDKSIHFIYDCERYQDVLYTFDILVMNNENLLSVTQETRWAKIYSEETKTLFQILRSHGITMGINEPVWLTEDNFKQELGLMFEESYNAIDHDGVILTPIGAPYYDIHRGPGTESSRIRFKPPRMCTFDLLLKAVDPSILTHYGIEVPKETKRCYIAYTTTTHYYLKMIPRPEIRRGTWRSLHFPDLPTHSGYKVPCPFITSVIPTSHVVISTSNDDPDYDDHITECFFDHEGDQFDVGWMKPKEIREDKTIEYLSNHRTFGNGYINSLDVLASALDPITKERLENIATGPTRYFHPEKIISREEFTMFMRGSNVGKAIIYGKYLTPKLINKGRVKAQEGSASLIEIGGGRGSDIARAFCAGARKVFVIDPDPLALLKYFKRGINLYGYYGNSPESQIRRSKMGIEHPIIHPPSAYSIPTEPQWSLRTILGKIGEDDDDRKKVTAKLLRDNDFPKIGVSAISVQFAIHYICETDVGLDSFKQFCDDSLVRGGRIGISYFNGDKIRALFDKKTPPHPWKIVKGNDNAMELWHTSGSMIGRRKFYIERRWKGDDKIKMMGVLLPTISPAVTEEALMSPHRLELKFLDGYSVIYGGSMFEEPDYMEALRPHNDNRDILSIEDAFLEEDFAWLGLINLLILEKVIPKRAKKSLWSTAV